MHPEHSTPIRRRRTTATPCPQAAVAMDGITKHPLLNRLHSGAFRRRYQRIKPPRRIRCGMDASIRSYQNARERRIPIENAQHLVAAAIRHFEQHTVNTGFPVGREHRLVCRGIEHCY
jgi:hypothetical protein